MYDMKNLARLSELERATPESMAAFEAFSDAAFADGAVPRMVKELIAVAVALATQCPYCIEIHSKEARKFGAGDAELAEAAMVSAAIRAGGTVTHAAHMFGSRKLEDRVSRVEAQ
jgi:AhpD family alkylhydroperoxidase